MKNTTWDWLRDKAVLWMGRLVLLLWVLAMLVLVKTCVGFLVVPLGGWDGGQEVTVVVRDTLRDTVVVRVPVPVDSVVLRYVRVRVPVVGGKEGAVPVDSVVQGHESTTAGDSLGGGVGWMGCSLMDSVEAVLPITQKHYKDSVYEAWVSGYGARLDSIRVQRERVREVVRIEKSARRWSVGVQGGVGMTPKGVLPYVGVGVAWRLTR